MPSLLYTSLVFSNSGEEDSWTHREPKRVQIQNEREEGKGEQRNLPAEKSRRRVDGGMADTRPDRRLMAEFEDSVNWFLNKEHESKHEKKMNPREFSRIDVSTLKKQKVGFINYKQSWYLLNGLI